jgi:hypothetical protein
MTSFARNANINTQKIAHIQSSNSDLSSHTSVSRGHFQVNFISIVSSCNLGSEAKMKTTRIPICMTTVAKAIIQPNLLSVTKYEYTESLPTLLKADLSSTSIFISISFVKVVP